VACSLPKKPRLFPTCIKLLPFCWFNFDTMVSAGWETTAQKTPATNNGTNLVRTYWRYFQRLIKFGLKFSGEFKTQYNIFRRERIRVSLHFTYTIFFFFWHAPLGVHSTKHKHRHQSPEWTILSHNDCFIQGEVIGFQVLLDSLHPHCMMLS